MLKFDIFSMRVALGCLASAAQVCLGDWFIEPKPKERKKIAYKMVGSIKLKRIFSCDFVLLLIRPLISFSRI